MEFGEFDVVGGYFILNNKNLMMNHERILELKF